MWDNDLLLITEHVFTTLLFDNIPAHQFKVWLNINFMLYADFITAKFFSTDNRWIWTYIDLYHPIMKELIKSLTTELSLIKLNAFFIPILTLFRAKSKKSLKVTA